MAWSAGAALAVTTASNTANNQASISITPGSSVTVGTVLILGISQDNAGTGDTFVAQGGTGVCVSTVTDTVGNTWLRAGEFENGQGAAQAGVVCSAWYSQLTNSYGVTDQITASFLAGSSASFDESALTLLRFGVDSGNTVLLSAATGLAADGSTGHGVIDQTVSTGDNLRVRFTASESSHVTALSTTAGWTAFNPARSGNVAGATAIRGEYLITASSTAQSACSFDAALDHASVYFVLRENITDYLMGQSIF